MTGKNAVRVCLAWVVAIASAAAMVALIADDLQACTCYGSSGGCAKCSGCLQNVAGHDNSETTSENPKDGSQGAPVWTFGSPEYNSTDQDWRINVKCVAGNSILDLCYSKDDASGTNANGTYDLQPAGDVNLVQAAGTMVHSGGETVGTNTILGSDGFRVTAVNGAVTTSKGGKSTGTNSGTGSGSIPGGDWTQTSDEEGRPTFLEEKRGGMVVKRTYFRYAEGNLTGVLLRKRVTEETYDTDGSKRLITWLYDYDADGNVTAAISPDQTCMVIAGSGYGYVEADPGAEMLYDQVVTGQDTLAWDIDDFLAASVALTQYEYDVEGRLTYEHGTGCCGGVFKAYRHAYGDNPNYPTGTVSDEVRWNTWKTYRRIMPVDADGNGTCDRVWRVEFLNSMNRMVFLVEQEMALVNGVPTVQKRWITHNIHYYDDPNVQNDEYRAGVIREKREPSACTAYTTSTDTVASGYFAGQWTNSVTANDNGTSGLVHLYEYHNPSRQITVESVKNGAAGTARKIRENTYTTKTYDGVSIYPLSNVKVYTNEAGSSYNETTYAYTYYQDASSVDTLAVETETVTYPSVDTDQNGPGSSIHPQVIRHFFRYDLTGDGDYDDVMDMYFNDWTKHEDGTYSYTELGIGYSNHGAVTRQITDVGENCSEANLILPPNDWSLPATGQNLVTKYEYYNTTFDTSNDADTNADAANYGQLKSVTAPGLRKTVYEYMSRKGQHPTNTAWLTTCALVTLSTPHMDGDDDYDYAPMNITITDLAGRTIVSATGTADTDEDGILRNDIASTWYTYGLVTSFTSGTGGYQGTLLGLSLNTYDAEGKLTDAGSYYVVAAQSVGYHTVYRYDDHGRTIRTIQVYDKLAGDTYDREQVTKTVYDAQDRVIEVWQGVSGGSHSMTLTEGETVTEYGADPTLQKVSATFYDEATPGSGSRGASDIGDGLVTSTRRYFGTNSYDWTGSVNHYNWRHQLRGSEPCYGYNGSPSYKTDMGPYTVYDVDWLGRTVSVAQFVSQPTWSAVLGDEDYAESATNTSRRTLSTSLYDTRGRVYRQLTYTVNSSTDAKGDAMRSDTFYDKRGRVVGAFAYGMGGGAEYAYDGAGRQTESRVVIYAKGSDLGDDYYDANGIFYYRDPQPGSDAAGDDGVMEMTRLTYDAGGNVIARVHYTANADSSDTNTGISPADDDDYVRTFVFSWYDALGRLTKTADYGCAYTYENGGQTYHYWGLVADGNVPARATDPSTVSRSDYVLVTDYAYGADGRPSTVTDPKTSVTQYTYDALGRTIKVEEDVSGGTEGTSTERTTLVEYNGLSQVTRRIADVGNDTTLSTAGKWTGGTVTDDQVTTYLYDNSYDAGLVTSVIYPDSSDTSSSGTDQVKLTYHLDGSPATRTAQRSGSDTAPVLTYTYDTLRRLKQQSMTVDGTGVDTSIRSILMSYDTLGRVEKVASYSQVSPGGNDTPANEVQYAYADTGQLYREYQAHDGAVNTGSTPYVQYTFDTTSSDGYYENALRLTQVQYPGGKQIDYNYDSGIGSFFNRPYAILENGSTYHAYYQYCGAASRIYQQKYWSSEAAKLNGDYVAGVGYKNWDTFGRVVRQQWTRTLPSPVTTLDQFDYTYDRNSNRLSRDNGLSTTRDEKYSYDDLNRLTRMQRGELSGGSITNEVRQEDWTLDPLGNWSEFKVDLDNDDDYDGATELNQDRTHNKVNEIWSATAGAAITETSGQSTWADPLYDARGNMTTMPKPTDLTATYACGYDAWNRLVKVQSGETTVAEYEYDGLGRRIRKTVTATSTDYDSYYNRSWQVLEIRKNGSANPWKQYVWSLAYIDQPVVRFYDANTDGDVTDTGDNTLYYLTDANQNVTALVERILGTSSRVVERYAYDAYGRVTVLNGVVDSAGNATTDWTVRTANTFDNDILCCGYLLDTELGGLDTNANSPTQGELRGLYHVRNRMYNAYLGRWLQRDPAGYVDGDNLYTVYRVMNMTDPLGNSVTGNWNSVTGNWNGDHEDVNIIQHQADWDVVVASASEREKKDLRRAAGLTTTKRLPMVTATYDSDHPCCCSFRIDRFDIEIDVDVPGVGVKVTRYYLPWWNNKVISSLTMDAMLVKEAIAHENSHRYHNSLVWEKYKEVLSPTGRCCYDSVYWILGMEWSREPSPQSTTTCNAKASALREYLRRQLKEYQDEIADVFHEDAKGLEDSDFHDIYRGDRNAIKATENQEMRDWECSDTVQ